jgi:RES domain-containing protein
MGPDRLPTVHVQAVAYRYSSYDTPLWARPNSEAGRWHTPEDGPTQYLSLSADGVWAELIRHEELTSEQEISLVNITIWAIKVDQMLIVDYSTFERAESAGFDPDALVADDQARCRREGRRLRDLGHHGVLAPSAALPGECNLTLFGARIASSWDQAPLLASSMPSERVATGGPPSGLLGSVRARGAPHAGLVAFRADRAQAPSDSEPPSENR